MLNLIRKTYPSQFALLDTQNIGNDLDNEDWTKYKLSKSSPKAKCIVSIISSAQGITCQDRLMDTQIGTYAYNIVNKYGEMSADAVAECINIQH